MSSSIERHFHDPSACSRLPAARGWRFGLRRGRRGGAGCLSRWAWRAERARQPGARSRGLRGAAVPSAEVAVQAGPGRRKRRDSDRSGRRRVRRHRPERADRLSRGLDPHGQWVDDPTYGTVWQPSPSEVGVRLRSYVSGGHWGYDDSDEYVWMSDYGLGVAPFHYGRSGVRRAPWVGLDSGPDVCAGMGYLADRCSRGFGYVGWALTSADLVFGGRAAVALGLGYVPRAAYGFCGVHDMSLAGCRGEW